MTRSNSPILAHRRRSHRAGAGPARFAPVGVQLTAEQSLQHCARGIFEGDPESDDRSCAACGFHECACNPFGGEAIDCSESAAEARPLANNDGSYGGHELVRKAAAEAPLAPGWQRRNRDSDVFDHLDSRGSACVWAAREADPADCSGTWGYYLAGHCDPGMPRGSARTRDEAMARALGFERSRAATPEWMTEDCTMQARASAACPGQWNASRWREDRWERRVENTLLHAIAWCLESAKPAPEWLHARTSGRESRACCASAPDAPHEYGCSTFGAALEVADRAILGAQARRRGEGEAHEYKCDVGALESDVHREARMVAKRWARENAWARVVGVAP